MRNIRTIALLLILSINSTSVFAQADLPIPGWHFIDKATVPAPTNDMPYYAQLLYSDEVNLIELEQAFTNHYDRVGWEKQLEDLEHDPYAKFFNHWFTEAQNYIEDDGMVRSLGTPELLERRSQQKLLEEKINNQLRSSGPTSTWSFVGPKNTLWRVDHNPSQPTAPWQVNIYSIAVAPSNPSILYCGSETGALYKTTDKGLNWTAFNDYNWGRAILSIAIHPTDPDIVYVATSTDIFKTNDGGANWSIIYTESSMSCNSIAISPSTPTTLFAGTSNGLYKSTDSGTNWTTSLTEQIDDVKFRPNDGTTVYVLARTGAPDTYTFYKSTDSGATFSSSMIGWGTIYEQSGGRLSVTPADDDYVYAVLLTHDGSGNDQKPYIMKSTDAAANWTTAATCNGGNCPLNNGQGYYDLDIVASHNNPDHLIAATTSAYKSVDGGVTWSIVGGYSGEFGIHPDIQEMVCIMDGGTENTWLTTDGGVNFSTDFYSNTANWEARITGLDGTNFWGFAQGWNEDYIIGGRYHNGNTVIHENYPDQQALRLGGAESVTGWAMHGRERYAAFDDIAEMEIPANIDEAPGASFLFTKHPQNYYYGDAYSRVMMDLEDYMTIYIGEGNSFWRSQDGGGSWEAIHTFGSGKPYHFDISRANPDHIYLAADNGFYRSTDRGESFTEMSLPTGMSDWNCQNFRVAASSSDEDAVWVLNHRSGSGSSAGRVFKSTNGGSTWTDWTTSTLSGRKWTAMAHQIGTDGGIYIASNRGDAGTMPSKVMYRDNTMSDWADFSDGLPESANPIKLLPFYRDGKLRWGGNRGAWEVDFYEENWSAIAQPFVSGKTQICIRDTVNFDSYSVVLGTATYSWSIPGASWTSDLNQREVQALFPSNGTYTATLTVSQSGSSDSKSIDVIIEDDCDAEQTPGNALSLSGASTDYAATNKALNITTNTMTISTWIKRNGNQNDYAGIVFMRNGTASGLNFRTNNELGFHWNNDQWWWSSGLVPTDNEWAHVAMVVSATDITLYLNGVPAVNTTDPAVSTFDGVMNFGADPNWSARRFNGEMDEVLIYNRVLSQDEIRELMHLTRMPENETDLLAYWQFNRTEGTITDRVGTNHASLIGGASRVTSTAPVGPGESARETVTTAGVYSFGLTDLELEFPSGGSVFPNGELCITRLDHAPDQYPDAAGPEFGESYWIVHNYGTNTAFDELTSLKFDSVSITGGQAAAPEFIRLYKRGSNEDGNTWGSPEDAADAATAGDEGDVTFSTDNGQTSFSQYILFYNDAPLSADLNLFNIWLNRDKEVELRWSSFSEENMDYYEIQRSQDGVNFQKIGLVEAVGESNTVQTYKATDIAPLRGLSYYRLKMVDTDESFKYSEIRSIMIDGLADKVIVYPNPVSVNSLLQVKTHLTGPLQLILYSIDGEEAGTYNFSGDHQIDISHLPKGFYTYEIRHASWRKSGKLVLTD